LFAFENGGAVDWAPVALPDVEGTQPAPKVAADNGLKITFDGGDWPAIGTKRIPIEGNWREFQTLKADLTVDRPCVACVRISQGEPDAKGQQPHYERTLTLQPGLNAVTLLIRHGIGSMDPEKGNVTSFALSMFRPEKGQTLLVQNVRLSRDWPPPKVLGWYSPYNHDGYSSAAAQDYARTGAVRKFKVLGTELEVESLPALAAQLMPGWSRPEPKAIEQVEAEFRAEFQRLKKDHPQAVLAILREGEQGWDPAHPDRPYEGWKYVYLNCHGPSGPNRGREVTPPPSETAEVFMRHRSVLLRADLSSIPAGATILAARLVVTRASAGDLKPPDKPNLWVTEPCNREWDPTCANCYQYAPGKLWKGVSGLYYGEDPDFWPVFLSHGPAGGGAVSVWDFTEGVRFWTDHQRANHGFFLHGDSKDYMRMYTPIAKNPKDRPAVMVIYERR
jgi:hypothetical protein